VIPQIAYDIQEAAAAVSVSPSTIRVEIHAGQLRAKKLGRAYRIGAEELRTWFEQLADAG
jgi:excisionase family DNA binding protein